MRKRKSRKTKVLDKVAAKRLYDERARDSEIAWELNVAEWRVKWWRFSNGYPQNRPGERFRHGGR